MKDKTIFFNNKTMSIEEIFDDTVKDAMIMLNKQNKDKLDRALISKIPTSNTYLNSVNIAVGKQESGKSFKLIEEIVKISRVSTNTHLLIYSNKTGCPSDDTFETQKDLIKIPIEYIAHDELPEYMEEFLMWKDLYKEIKEDGLEERIDNKQKQELFEKMKINDFSRPCLHTLVFLEDVAQAKIIKTEKTYINELMTQCRHIHCSFFLAIQFWKAVPTGLKSQITTLYIYGGYSKQQLRYIFSQTNVPVELNEIWSKYILFKNHEKIVVDAKKSIITYE
jgi:hypothetical protein